MFVPISAPQLRNKVVANRRNYFFQNYRPSPDPSTGAPPVMRLAASSGTTPRRATTAAHCSRCAGICFGYRAGSSYGAENLLWGP